MESFTTTFPAALEGRVIERVPQWRAKFEMCTQADSCKRGSIDQWIVKLSLTQSRTADSAGSEIVLVHPTDTITAAVPPEAVPQKKSVRLGRLLILRSL